MKKKIFSSIRSRMLIYTIAIIFLVGTVLGSVVFYALFSIAQNDLIRESETSLLYIANSINSNIDSVRSAILSNQISSSLADFCLENDSSNSKIKTSAHEFLQDIYMSNSGYRNTIIRSIVVGNNRSDIIQYVEASYSSSQINKEALTSQYFFNQAIIDESNPTSGIIKDPFLKTRTDMIPFVYTIYHPYRSDSIGYVYTEMSASALSIPIASAFPAENNQYYIKMGDKLYLYNEGFFEISDNPVLVNLPLNSSNFTVLRNKKILSGGLLTVSYPLGINDWYIINCTDSSRILNNFFRLLIILLLSVIVFSVLVGVILYRLLSRMVNIPVQKLTDRILRIESGDFTRDQETEWDNELGDIGRTINNLAENVYSLMNQRIEDEKQKKDYEYQILQSQINPHFLYNTLNSIKWMATIQNAPGIAEMTTALSRLLKDISKGTNTIITLEHELALIDDYFTIQSYRYGGTISLTKDIESDDLLDCNILRFTLQPLIENAIFHGIEPKGTSGTISITVYRDEDVFIEVCDDGVGMDTEAAIAYLNNTQKTKSSLFREVGIGNVNNRLKYEFGEKYGMTIDSVINEYTTVTIRIPYQKSE